MYLSFLKTIKILLIQQINYHFVHNNYGMGYFDFRSTNASKIVC